MSLPSAPPGSLPPTAPPAIPDLPARIRGCWLGKNIGGTLGGPHEGKPGPLDLRFYDPVPDRVLANDDLDLQLVWLHHLLTGGHRSVTPDLLAEAWSRHVRFPFDEYGVTLRNHAQGLKGLARGSTDNYFAECMGGAIRSEIWACVAAGQPARAAGLAWADASVDHCGDGVYAEVFHAALQAAAFVQSDREALLDTALAFVPAATRLGAALRATRTLCRAGGDWRVQRAEVVRRYGTTNFTDVVCNLCFELIGWYAGRGDFARSICIAVNCGLDTDCTGATLGALLGIIDPASIPATWVRPIGEDVVLSPQIVGVTAPRDLEELTAWTLRLREQLADFNPTVGSVFPHLPPLGSPGATITGKLLAAPVVSSTATPPSDFKHARTIERGGHWWRFTAHDFRATGLFVQLRFHLPRSEPVKLMAYHRPGLEAWVDGHRCLAYSAADLARDPFVAPSFHRAGPAAVVLTPPALKPGWHELVLALERPARGEGSDLVFGVADATTNLWLPDAFV